MSARRPLIIVGGGAYLSGAGTRSADFATEFGIAIQTTPAGRSTVAETHPLFIGLTGLYRTTVPREIFEESDLIITAGSRMEEFQGGFLPRPANPKIIQIEIDPFEIGRNWLPDVAIESDCRLAIEALRTELATSWSPTTGGPERKDSGSSEEGNRGCSRRRDGANRAWRFATLGEISRLHDQRGLQRKNDSGQGERWSGSLGILLALLPGTRCQLLCGPGGTDCDGIRRDRRHGCQTWPTRSLRRQHVRRRRVSNVDPRARHCRADKTPVTWVVLDDGAFGWVQWIQRRNPGSQIVATEFEPHVDLVAIAEACGCSAERLADPRNLRAAAGASQGGERRREPHVLVVPIDQSHHHAEFDRFHDFEPAPGSATA